MKNKLLFLLPVFFLCSSFGTDSFESLKPYEKFYHRIDSHVPCTDRWFKCTETVWVYAKWPRWSESTGNDAVGIIDTIYGMGNGYTNWVDHFFMEQNCRLINLNPITNE